MSIRENIAANIVTTLTNMSSPITLKKVTRDPFDYERLSNAQFPAAWVQSGDETRADATIGATNVKRLAEINYRIVGFVKGINIDTARNELIEAIEEALDVDRTRGGNALITEVLDVGADDGALEPVGGITMTVQVRYQYGRGAV